VIVNHLVGKGHVYEPIALMLPDPLAAIMRGGYQAVPTFFVLSGLVLARTYGCTSWTAFHLRKYFAGRFARVYPVYLLSLLIVAPFIWKAKDQAKGWLVAMHLTLTQGWLVGHYTAGWNTPAWSLSCEMFFYVMFPVLIVLLRDRRWGWTAGAAVVGCLMTPAMIALGVSDQLKPITHLSDFVVGIAVSRMIDLLPGRAGQRFYWAGLLGSGLILGYAHVLPDRISPTTLLRPMNALLLLGLGLGGGWIARILSLRPIVYLGRASYAMYILHIPILWWAVSWPQFAVRYLYVAFVVGLSCLVYSVFEEPANRFLRSLVSGSGLMLQTPYVSSSVRNVVDNGGRLSVGTECKTDAAHA
jgi:peptidoglycan/LPS O-acetylase OafA/YrhL